MAAAVESNFLPVLPEASSDGATEIARLTSPGHKFRNLNPFWVLGVSHKGVIDKESINKTFRNRSRIVHPDKFANNPELAGPAAQAFDFVKHAHSQLTSYDGAIEDYSRICGDAEAKILHDDRKRQKRAAKERRPPSPFDLASAIVVETCNRIADAEAERIVAMKIKEATDVSRAEEAERRERKRTAAKAFQQEWEKDRDTRVDSWRNFSKKKRKLGGWKETPRIDSREVPQGLSAGRPEEEAEQGDE